MDISNGPGMRVSLFTQGCPHHCDHCFNPETWSYSGGKDFTSKEKDLILNLCSSEYCSGLSILGGEPLIMENLSSLKDLLLSFKEKFPEKTIWMWTGYLIENLTKEQFDVARLCDVIIDGPFVNELKDLNLLYAGSKNQRFIKILHNEVFVEEKMPSK